MSEFILLFRSNPAERREHMETPEQARASMQAWLDWIRELERSGHLKDPGQPLDMTGAVVRTGKVVTDGPYVEAKDLVLGFSIVKARDLKEAIEIAHGCPILGGKGSVEVRPVAVMAGP